MIQECFTYGGSQEEFPFPVSNSVEAGGVLWKGGVRQVFDDNRPWG